MPEPVRILSFDEVVDGLLRCKEPYHEKYLAMYSSYYGGIVTDPALMAVPVDDHLVHRGDGIFEAFLATNWNIYLLNRHLDRLERSARGAMLQIPVDRQRMVEIIRATGRAANVPDIIFRLYVSRGPGGFSANPYECPKAQVYVVAVRHDPPPKEKYERGVLLKTSSISMKNDVFATIKTCNYLPNVLMNKEALDAGVDFTVSMDERGCLGEGPTENFGIVTKAGAFVVPRFDRILRGTTVLRTMDLARTLVQKGELSGVEERDILPEEARDAAEIMMFGTSFHIFPVVEYDGRPIGSGKPGPMFRRLLDLMEEDARSCREMLTPVREE
ncbi:MAG: aminotransferase class IV [Syntrophobacteraceae bacterium]|nr:aminotransferase class IV [Desulfobacteraceae bacterium]